MLDDELITNCVVLLTLTAHVYTPVLETLSEGIEYVAVTLPSVVTVGVLLTIVPGAINCTMTVVSA